MRPRLTRTAEDPPRDTLYDPVSGDPPRSGRQKRETVPSNQARWEQAAVTRRIYPNPPIVEAVIEFRFEPRGDAADLAQTLRKALGDTYDADQTRTQDWIEAEVSVADGGVAAAARRTPHVTFLQSASGHRLLGCGPGSLSVHTLAPYPGWESFIAQAEEAVGALPGPLADAPVLSVSVRYIDRIELPADNNIGFADFITVMPPRPAQMPNVLSGCYYATQATDPEDGTFALLTVASAPGAQSGSAALTYDLVLRRAGQPLCSFQLESWKPTVEGLHTRQREIFEESITDRTRELFQ